MIGAVSQFGAAHLRRRAVNQLSGEPCGVVLLLRSDVLRAGCTVPPVVISTAAREARLVDEGLPEVSDDLAANLSTGCAVAVALVLRIHGSALGLPNPGLLPTARERDAGQERMIGAIRALREVGAEADGEILVTRNPARAVARVAQRRGAAVVLVEPTPTSSLRRFLEGDVSRQLGRRLAPRIRVAEIPDLG